MYVFLSIKMNCHALCSTLRWITRTKSILMMMMYDDPVNLRTLVTKFHRFIVIQITYYTMKKLHTYQQKGKCSHLNLDQHLLKIKFKSPNKTSNLRKFVTKKSPKLNWYIAPLFTHILNPFAWQIANSSQLKY